MLIKVHATTANRTDCGFRSAEYFISRFFSGLFRPKTQVLGNEFAGEIEAVGKDVKLFQPGDKVFGYNDITFGAHAEYMVMAENGPITTLPANFTYEEAAPITKGGHYALCDIRAAKVRSGQKVLIKTFDFVFDAVGKSSYGKCKPLLRKGGIYISTELGHMGQNPFLALITPLLGGKKLLFRYPPSAKKM